MKYDSLLIALDYLPTNWHHSIDAKLFRLAGSADIARALYLKLSGHVSEDDDIFLDVPQFNDEAVKLAEQFAMTQCFETARMYTQTEPDI